MKKFSLKEYRQMANRFNKMTFSEKIQTLRDNGDILTLGSDYNWWVVKVRDKEIQEKLYETDTDFHIENEWGHREMQDLISLLGIGLTDA